MQGFANVVKEVGEGLRPIIKSNVLNVTAVTKPSYTSPTIVDIYL